MRFKIKLNEKEKGIFRHIIFSLLYIIIWFYSLFFGDYDKDTLFIMASYTVVIIIFIWGYDR